MIKLLIFLVALTMQYWLWGQPNDSIRMTQMLWASVVMVFLLLGLPMREIFKKRDPRKIFSKIWVKAIFYIYVLLVIIMSVFSFSGWIKVLLPIKIFLLAISLFFKSKLKKIKFFNSKDSSQ